MAREEPTTGLVAIVEALLFAAATPVPLPRLLQVVDGASRRDLQDAIEVIRARLEGEGHGIELVEVAGGYQLRTRAEHAPWIRRLLGGRPPRLSRAMLETLAIVAYKQPCTRPEIEAIRGVDVDHVMSTLVERRLARILGRKDAPGRPILYGTTTEFLEVFGLPDLEALPALKEIGDLAEVLNDPDLAVTLQGVLPSVDADVGPDADHAAEEATLESADAEGDGGPDGDDSLGA